MTVLHVEGDPRYYVVARRLIGTCTREQWERPLAFQQVLDRFWKLAVEDLRSVGETLITPAPVILYREPLTGRVRCADIRTTPTGPSVWVDPQGYPLVFPPNLAGLVVDGTTYACWAEGPRIHLNPEMPTGTLPTDDRDLQRYRAQNSALRGLLDRATSPSAWAMMTRSANETPHLVDFVFRGAFKRRDYRVTKSLQTGEDSYVLGLGEKVDTLDLYDSGQLPPPPDRPEMAKKAS